MTDSKDRLEIIREMRAIDSETGKPKHTQKEVAERIGLTRARVSQIEREHNLKPHQITYGKSNQEDSDEIQASESGNQIGSEDSGHENGDGGIGGMSDSDSNSNPESDSGSETQSDDWICTECGNNTYYSATQYLNEYGDKIDKGHIRTLNSAEKVCASCGNVE